VFEKSGENPRAVVDHLIAETREGVFS
jgi:hypothetical protein